MVSIKVRRIVGTEYRDIIITIGNAKMELGLYNEKEIEQLREELRDCLEALD